MFAFVVSCCPRDEEHDAQSDQSSEEVRPVMGPSSRLLGRPHAVWRADVSQPCGIDPLSALNGSGADHLQPVHGRAGDPLTPAGILKLTTRDACGRIVEAKDRYCETSRKNQGGLLEFERLAEAIEEDVIAHLTK